MNSPAKSDINCSSRCSSKSESLVKLTKDKIICGKIVIDTSIKGEGGAGIPTTVLILNS